MKLTRFSLFLLFSIITSLTLNAQSIGGDWEGELKVGQMNLKLRIHILPEQNKVTFDSPDQGAFGLECVTNILTPDSLNISIPKIGMNYCGRYDNDVIKGTFSQSGFSLPVDFNRMSTNELPQSIDIANAPYTTEEVKITNTAANATLAGTLTLPQHFSKKTPVVVLVTGSGLQNRDEELFGHKPFAVIADYLARNGIASLRYDDRGFAESTGDGENATTVDFASDAQAIVDWLRNANRFGKVGIIGHSEGGQIAYMLGADKKIKSRPDFIVSIAGPVVRGSATVADQNRYALVSAGVSENEADNFSSALEKSINYILDNPDCKEIDETLLLSFYPDYKQALLGPTFPANVENMHKMIDESAWLKHFLSYEASEDLKNLSIPTFIIFGEIDRQVSPDLNANLARNLAPGAYVKVYPQHNHVMQHAVTGAVSEYATITETFSPEVLADIVTFINKAVK